MVNSKSTDKLNIICSTAKDILTSNPEMQDKLKSVSIVWKEIDGMAVPDVKIEFYEKGLNLNKSV